MRIDKLSVLALSLFLLAFTVSAAGQIPTMTTGQNAGGQLYKADNYKGYHLLKVASIQKKYLFITLVTEQIYQHLNMDLLIYRSGEQEPFKKCEKEQVDSCYLSKNEVSIDQMLVVVVQSKDDTEMTYKLLTYWSDLEHIVINQEVRFMFSPTEQKQIYHLELKDTSFQELRILIKPQTRRYPFDKIKMYGTFGQDSLPSSQNYDFKSYPLWQDSEGVYLFKSQLKQMKMNLILYGMTQTVYTMKCWLANSTHNDLPINNKIHEYMEKNEEYTYHIQFKDQQGKYQYDNYVFRMSVFFGDLDFKLYTDEHKTRQITQKISPFMYQGDFQFFFEKDKIESQMPNGLFFNVKAGNRVATFLLQFEGRTKSGIFELHQHIYEIMQVDQVKKMYFKVGKFKQQGVNPQSQVHHIQFSQVDVYGTTGLDFRLCKTTEIECLNENVTSNSQILETELRKVGSKTTHSLVLTQQMFRNINTVEQSVVVVVNLANRHQNSSSVVAVQYSVGNRPEFLRENKPMQSHVRKGQLKTYKYRCTDPLVTKVRVHVNTISGCFYAYAFRTVPSKQELNNQTGRIKNGLIQVTDRLLDDPLVIIISGIDTATYSIVVQTITDTKEELSYITLSEDVQFKSKIAPNQYQVFEIVPISSSIFFKYKSSEAVHVCLLDDKGVCKDQKEVPTISNRGDIVIKEFYDRYAYVKVGNPSSEHVVEVSSIFHSNKENHCELVGVGQLFVQIFGQGSCVYSVLNAVQDYEVMMVHEEYSKFVYKMLLCDQLLNFPHNDQEQQRYLLTKDMIELNCKQHDQYTFSIVSVGDLNHLEAGKLVNATSIRVKYIIQEVNGITLLPDGVGYKGRAKSTQEPIKKFSYQLLNKDDTSIVVSTRSKLYFLVKVVESVYKNNVTMSLSDFHFSSPTDKYFFLESLNLRISGPQLLKYTCSACELLIYLYSKQPVGEMVQYSIQVSQNFIILEDGHRKQNYLSQNSKAYYGYNAKGKGHIIVQLSDNNMNCAQIYMSSTGYPDENSFNKKSFDGQLIYENTKENPTTYYITVNARENCAYSIGADLMTGERNVFKLERGILGHLSLQEGQVKYYTFKHMSDASFKILSLHKYGRVNFYLNQTTNEKVASLMLSNSLNYKDFAYQAQHKNRLLLNSTHKQFCNGCVYLLAVVAQKNTEAALYLGDQLTKVPLSEEKVLNDILPQVGSTTKGEFYLIQNGIMEVKVHSGKLQARIQYGQEAVSTTFEKVETISTFNFTLQRQKDYYGTASVNLKALTANTVYSLRIKSVQAKVEEGAQADKMKINPQQGNFIFIGKKPNCITGYLKTSYESLFISFYNADRQKLEYIKLVATLNGQLTQVSHMLTRNVMMINFLQTKKHDFTKGIPYELCLSVNDSLSAVVMQTEDATTLPANTEMVVIGKQTYDIYPQGQFLLDVFECRGIANIAYGSSKKELEGKKEKVLDVVGMTQQSHAVKIQRGYFNMLLSITSPLALVRWLPISTHQEKGIGYYLYSAGSLRYDTAFGEINFFVSPVKSKNQKTKTKLVNVKYSFYISNSEEDLKQASLCERYLPESVLEYKTIHEQISSKEFKYTLNKNMITEKYQQAQNLFAVIVADVTLQTPDKSTQYYRFVYNRQEIPSIVFTPSGLQQYELTFLIIFLVVLMMTLVVCACLCTKVFVPMISRLRSRMLVEEGEGEGDKKEEREAVEIEPPPSSDRQGIIPDGGNPGTDVRMS